MLPLCQTEVVVVAVVVVVGGWLWHAAVIFTSY